MFISELSFAWFSVFIIVAIAIFNRLVFRSWAAPGAFFALFWVVMTVAPLTLAPHYPVWGAGVLVLASFVLAISIGTYMGNEIYVLYCYKPNMNMSEKTTKLQLKQFTLYIQKAGWVGALLGLIGMLLAVQSGFESISMEFSLTELPKSSSALSYARYNEDLSMPLSARVANAIIFFACFISGMVLRFSNGWVKVLLPLTVLSSTLIYAFTFTNKAPFFMGVLMIGGSYLASSVLVEGVHMRLFNSMRLAFSAIVLMFGISMLIISQMLRYGLKQLEYDSVVFERAQSYALAHLAAFTGWIKEGYSLTDAPSMGVYSFSGQLRILGLKEQLPGLYEAKGLHAEIVGSNVFTAFRGLMQDFTYPGTIIVLIITGIIVQLCYLSIALGYLNQKVPAFVILVAFYTWTAFSFAINIFSYNSNVLAVILFSIFLFVSQKKLN